MGVCHSFHRSQFSVGSSILLLRALTGLVAVVVIPVAAHQRNLSGTYIIVNRASGRRLCSGPSCDFAATAGGPSRPIYPDHRWRFVPQSNDTYAIVNAAHGVRVFAQSGKGNEHGFLTTDRGPIYQDQRWRLELQSDGSYVFANARSDRRMVARSGLGGSDGFSAVAGDQAIAEDQMWWLVDPDRDEAGPLLQQLSLATSSASENISAACLAPPPDECAKLRMEVLEQQDAVARVNAPFQMEREANSKLVEQVQASLINSTQAVVAEKAARSALEIQTRKCEDEKTRLADRLQASLINTTQAAAAEKAARRALELETEMFKNAKVLLEDQIQDSRLKAMQAAAFEKAALSLIELDMEKVEDEKAMLVEKLQASQTKAMQAEAAEKSARRELELEIRHFEDEKARLARKTETVVVCAISATALAALASFFCGGGRRRGLYAVARSSGQGSADDSVEQNALSTSITHGVFRADSDEEAIRIVKIQCPGVEHEDIEVEVIWSGCDVTIRRQASLGLDAATWRKRFQFDHKNGLFEFREDQMLLENGFLRLMFHASAFQGRAVRFPRHFSLAATDLDLCWEVDGSQDSERPKRTPTRSVESSPQVGLGSPIASKSLKDCGSCPLARRGLAVGGA